MFKDRVKAVVRRGEKIIPDVIGIVDLVLDFSSLKVRKSMILSTMSSTALEESPRVLRIERRRENFSLDCIRDNLPTPLVEYEHIEYYYILLSY
jgi:hypothetical protein